MISNASDRRMFGKNALHCLGHLLRVCPAHSQLTPQERECLARCAANRSFAVEIGVYHGASTALIRQHLDPGGRIVGIDPHPAGRLGFSLERNVALREIARHPGAQFDLWRMTSNEAAARWDEAIDLLFIDGDHSWLGIEDDWTNWSRLVVPGGSAVLHDTQPKPGSAELDSVRFYREVIAHDSRFEFQESVETLTVLCRL